MQIFSTWLCQTQEKLDLKKVERASDVRVTGEKLFFLRQPLIAFSPIV